MVSGPYPPTQRFSDNPSPGPTFQSNSLRTRIFSKRSSNREKLKTPTFIYRVDEKHSKSPFTRKEGYPNKRVTLALSHFRFVSSSRVYKAARVTRVGGLPHLRARFILTGGVTLSLVNTPGTVKPPTRVTFLIVSRPFECNRALSCPGL